MTTVLGLLFAFTSCFVSIYGHGYLFDPVARSSAWLIDQSFKQCCTYYDHMAMYCGGLQHQWNVNGGKCGICGEPYDRKDKLFEKGGAKYLGKIVKTYSQGQQIDVTVVLTANHKGYFEYRVCNLDSNPDSDATQDCLDRGLLKIAGTDSTKYRDVGNYGSEPITVRLQLPSDIACDHCVFQWKYTTGNSWGTDINTGESGPGMGVENETFMGCADISITADGSSTQTRPPSLASTRPPTKISRTRTTSRPKPTTARLTDATTSRPKPTTARLTDATTSRPKPTTARLTDATTSRPKPTTTRLTDATTSRPSNGMTTWSAAGVSYNAGDIVSYKGVRYQCVYNHVSFPGAEPGVLTWAWWQRID